MDAENLFEEYSVKCYRLKTSHEMSTNYYIRLNRIMNISNMSVVALIAISNNITTSIISKPEVVGTVYSIGLYFSVLMTSLQQFLQYEKIAEKHKNASVRSHNLYNSIKEYRALGPADKLPKAEFIKWLIKEIDIIYTSAPPIPTKIMDEYKSNKDMIEVFDCLKKECEKLEKVSQYTKSTNSNSNENSFIGSAGSSNIIINDFVIEIEPPSDGAITYEMQRFMNI